MRTKRMLVALAAVLLVIHATADEKVPEMKEPEKRVPDKKVAEKKEPDSYVKLKLEVEIRGILRVNNDEFVVVVDGEKKDWVLDFGTEKVLREGARAFNNKTVTVKGTALFRGVATEIHRGRGGFPEHPVEMVTTRTVLDIDRNLTVKSIEVPSKP